MRSCLFMMNTAAFGKKYGVVSCVMVSNITERDHEHIPHKHN